MFKLGRSSNPIINKERIDKMHIDTLGQETMTIQGAIDKTLILFAILLLTASFSFVQGQPVLTLVGAIGGLIVVLISVFKQDKSSFLAPLYAGLEGLFVGGISAMYAYAYNGIIMQAVLLTLSIMVVMLIIYRTRIIKVTDKFRMGVVMATGGIFLVYVTSFVLSFFGINVPYLHEGGMLGIGISLVIIAIAAFNLLLDFDNFERGAEHGFPKYMEWFFAMGLLITLVWLYVEILRLLSKLSRD